MAACYMLAMAHPRSPLGPSVQVTLRIPLSYYEALVDTGRPVATQIVEALRAAIEDGIRPKAQDRAEPRKAEER